MPATPLAISAAMSPGMSTAVNAAMGARSSGRRHAQARSSVQPAMRVAAYPRKNPSWASGRPHKSADIFLERRGRMASASATTPIPKLVFNHATRETGRLIALFDERSHASVAGRVDDSARLPEGFELGAE